MQHVESVKALLSHLVTVEGWGQQFRVYRVKGAYGSILCHYFRSRVT